MQTEEYDLIALIRKRKRDANKPIQSPPQRGGNTGERRTEEVAPADRPNNEPLVGNGGPALNQHLREQAAKSVRAPFVPYTRTPEDYPKNWENPPQIGDSVFYNGERYWVANAFPDWTYTSFVQVADKHIRPGQPVPRDTTVTSVHADKLKPAPTRGAALESQPTERRIEVEKRKKELHITDIGDEIGEMLRGKTLDQCYTVASSYLNIGEFVLMKKYSHLNPGMQRMNLGNRMRKGKS